MTSIKKIPLVHHVRELLCELCRDDTAEVKRKFTGAEIYTMLSPVLPGMTRESLATTLARMMGLGEIREAGRTRSSLKRTGGRQSIVYTADLVAINKVNNADGYLLRQMQAADRLADCVKSWK